MRYKRLLMVLIVLSVVLGSTPSSASANADTWPKCGEKTVVAYGAYKHENITISFESKNISYESKDISLSVAPYLYTIQSANGWKIYEIIIDDGQPHPVIESFLDGKTKYSFPSSVIINSIKVTLKKTAATFPPASRLWIMSTH